MTERASGKPGDGRALAPTGSGAYPRRLVAASARLLDIEYRLWRRDLKDPEQPLIEYGFRLSPDPAGIDGRACRYDSSDGQATIILQDLLIHGRAGGHAVAIDRTALTISTAWIHDWSPVARIVPGPATQADTLVPRLVSWIGGYEQWVLDSGNEGGRGELAGTLGLGGDLPSLWWRLAADWRAALVTKSFSG